MWTHRHAFVVLLVLVATAAAPIQGSAAPGQPRGDVGTRLLGLVNAYRASLDLPRLRPEQHLTRASDAYARAMFRGRFFGHTSPAGETFVERIERFGYGGRLAGEDLAWEEGYLDPAAWALRAWIASPPHLAVLRNRAYTQGAVGVFCGPGFNDTRAQRCYLVLDTGMP